jgi:hypothetical protein
MCWRIPTVPSLATAFASLVLPMVVDARKIRSPFLSALGRSTSRGGRELCRLCYWVGVARPRAARTGLSQWRESSFLPDQQCAGGASVGNAGWEIGSDDAIDARADHWYRCHDPRQLWGWAGCPLPGSDRDPGDERSLQRWWGFGLVDLDVEPPEESRWVAVRWRWRVDVCEPNHARPSGTRH